MIQRLQRNWRAIVGTLIVAAALLVVGTRRAEVLAVAGTLRHTRLNWLLVAILLQAIVYGNLAAVLWRALSLLGQRVSLRFLYKLAFVAIFLGRVLPSSGTAYLLYQFHQRGVPDGAAAVTATLNSLSSMSAFLILLLGGFLYVFAYGELDPRQLVLLLGLVLLAAMAFAFLWRLHRDRPLLTRRAMAIKNRTARLVHRSWSDRVVLGFISEIYDGLTLIRRNRWGFVELVGLQMLVLLVDSLALLCLFLSLGALPHFSVVLVSYGLAYFLSMITTLPGGGGSFEATMILAFSQWGITPKIALSVTLLYRLIAFWLPLVACAILYRRVQFRSGDRTDSPGMRLG